MSAEIYRPFKIAEKLLEIFLFRAVDFGALGDYEENFQYIAVEDGILKAHLWYLTHVIISFPSFIRNTLYWSIVMFKNYLVSAFRSLRRQKAYSIINIAGMAVGMAVFTFFALSAGTKLNSDEFHENKERIYSVIQVRPSINKEMVHTAYVPAPFVPALQREFSEIEHAVRVMPAGKLTLRRGDDSFYENNILFTDKDFFNIFTFKLSAGNPETALSEPYSIVLTETIARKYFGDENPIGQNMTLEKELEVKVTGILEDAPRTSSLRFDILVSMETARPLSSFLDDWSENSCVSFILLQEDYDKSLFDAKLPGFMAKHITDEQESPEEMYLFPFKGYRLRSGEISNVGFFISQSFASATYILLAIGVLLLLVVCINFNNLTIVRQMYRTKEIGLRKVIGARRSQLIKQFLGESILLALISIPAAILIYEIMHPVLTSYITKFPMGISFPVSNSIWNYPFLIKYLIYAALLTGFFSGFYPAFFLTSFNPVQALRGSVKSGRQKNRGRKIMIVFQFALSIFFILTAGILKDQVAHVFKADLGFARENVASLQITSLEKTKIDVLKTEFSRMAGVERITFSEDLPGLWESSGAVSPFGVDEANAIKMKTFGVDYNFVEVLGLELTMGRPFSKDMDDGKNFIINESAVKILKLRNPVGEQITVKGETGTVVGVAEDFLFSDIDKDIPPAVLYIDPDNINYMLIKLSSPDNFPVLREQLKEQWNIITPDLPFECKTLQQIFNEFFQFVYSIVGFLNFIGYAAVFFSCLGLLGLASYMVERRTKEIGIRKALGASVLSVTWCLIREYVIMIVIANAIILPLVYFGWQQVLQLGILFITDISAWTYFFAAFITLFIALAAVTSQTFKAARANPVNSLRYE